MAVVQQRQQVIGVVRKVALASDTDRDIRLGGDRSPTGQGRDLLTANMQAA
jgi:hypothetical protein